MPVRFPSRLTPGPARLLGPALAFLAVLPAHAAATDDNKAALAALADIKAAQQEIVAAEGSYSTDPATYRRADQRAVNALVGKDAPGFAAAAGSPADAAGAIGHIDRLLDRKETPRWADPLRGAEANLRAAVARLQEARRARELMDHEIAVSNALENLLAALGRPTEAGVLGGVLGALATTELGVPAGATEADACAPPSHAPSFGVHDGYLGFVALPATEGDHSLPEALGATRISVRGNMLIVHTAAAATVATLCRDGAVTHAEASSPAPGLSAAPISHDPAGQDSAKAPARQRAAGEGKGSGTTADSEPAQPKPASGTASSGGTGDPPALYTAAQAAAGAKVFSQHCVSCHGANLQGTAAPAVAGNDFLHAAKENGWTLEVIRYLVFNLMPFNNPDSLTPKQYADVTAFLLAVNCFPAGKTPFPEKDDPSFAQVHLGPGMVAQSKANKQGVCPVPKAS